MEPKRCYCCCILPYAVCRHEPIAICELGAGNNMKEAMIEFHISSSYASRNSSLTTKEDVGEISPLIDRRIIKGVDTCSMAHLAGGEHPMCDNIDGACAVG